VDHRPVVAHRPSPQPAPEHISTATPLKAFFPVLLSTLLLALSGLFILYGLMSLAQGSPTIFWTTAIIFNSAIFGLCAMATHNRSRTLIRYAAMMACVPYFGPWWIAGIPVGIGILFLLRRS